MINARKLGERDFNIFSHFFNNWMFLGIYVMMWVVQLGSVQFGGRPLRCMPLNMTQHLICAGIGAFSLVWGLIVKLIPGSWFDWVRMPEHEMDDKEEEQALTANLRKSFRHSRASRASTSRRSNQQAANGQFSLNRVGSSTGKQ